MRPARPVAALAAALVAGCALTLTGAAAPAAALTVPPEGGFFQIQGYDNVYEIVGGAPVWVTDWATVGGPHPTMKAPIEIWGQLADYPRDGTFVRASDGRAYRFVGGAPWYISTWKAFGGPQKTLPVDARSIANARGTSAGWYKSIRDRTWDYDGDGRHVFNIGNVPSPTPFNGHLFVRGGQTGRVYKMVGGAPLYVSSWKPFGGPKPAVTVDQAAIDHAGGPGPWRFVRKAPVDGWVIRGSQTNQLYIIAGGAPIYVGTPTYVEEPNVWPPRARWIPATVDQAVIDRSGGPAPFDNLRFYPADGTGVRIRPLPGSDTVTPYPTFRITGGVPEPGGPGGTEVDRAAIERAGEPGPWAHLRASH